LLIKEQRSWIGGQSFCLAKRGARRRLERKRHTVWSRKKKETNFTKGKSRDGIARGRAFLSTPRRVGGDQSKQGAIGSKQVKRRQGLTCWSSWKFCLWVTRVCDTKVGKISDSKRTTLLKKGSRGTLGSKKRPTFESEGGGGGKVPAEVPDTAPGVHREVVRREYRAD